MQAKPERQTPINAGAYASYNVMMKYIKKYKKYHSARLYKFSRFYALTYTNPICSVKWNKIK